MIDQEEVFVVHFFWKEQDRSILFRLPGSQQQKFLVLRFFDVKEQQGIDRGAQGDREAEVFQVSDDDTALAQRRLEDKQPEEKTNTDCLVKEQEKEYHTGWKIKTGNVLDSCNQRSTQKCTKSGSGLSKVLWAKDTTMSTYLVNRSPSSAIGFKTPVDMLGFFGWLAIKQGMLEPVKVKCIFLGYRKGIVGNKALEVRGRYFKGTGSVQVLQGVEFEVEPQDHTFEVEPRGNAGHEQHSAHELLKYREDSNEAAFAVAKAEKIYAHESLTFNNTVAYEVISMWKAGLKDDIDAWSDVYVLSHGCKKCSDDNDGYYWESTPEGSLSGDCDVEKNGKWLCIYAIGSQEYQMVCTRLDIASADVGMLDKFDRRLQTEVQVFVDFDYAMATKVGYMTFTETWKKEIWLKGLLVESEYELSLVAGIPTRALVKGGSRSEVPAQVEGVAYRY
ncbi:hypothetical protein Tco_0385449 [Tanacetum coccineum]